MYNFTVKRARGVSSLQGAKSHGAENQSTSSNLDLLSGYLFGQACSFFEGVNIKAPKSSFVVTFQLESIYPYLIFVTSTRNVKNQLVPQNSSEPDLIYYIFHGMESTSIKNLIKRRKEQYSNLLFHYQRKYDKYEIWINN